MDVLALIDKLDDLIHNARTMPFSDKVAIEREVRLGAEDYADEVLSTLEVNLGKFLSAVQRGRERLQRGTGSTDATGQAIPEPIAPRND